MARILTGFVLIIIGVFVLKNGQLPLFLFLSLISWLAFWEIKSFTELKSWPVFLSNIVTFQALFSLIYFNKLPLLFEFGYISLIFILFTIIIFEYLKKQLLFRSNQLLNNLKYFLYISLGLTSIYLIRNVENGLLYIILLFLSIWAADVFAFYGGKLFGRHPLSKVSPNKTIEGTVIGALMAMIVVAFYCFTYQFSYVFVVVAGLIGLLGQLGDLYESLIKRTYSIKDSSNLLPGHGGILDRADSSLFVAPIMYIIVVILS